jgi:pyruvate dehydrogenase E1 component
VRGNGKIIQELEADFRGTGWNVLKVIWGSYWDPLLAKDTEGILQRIMMETVDGEYQNYRANDGAFVRKHFFGKHPKLLEMVSRMTDEDIWRLNRGGHDPYKVYAAYHAAVNDNGGKPTLILAKTVKGFGMGKIGEGKNTTHQQKKLDADSIRQFRDRFGIPVSDDKLDELPFVKPADDAPEMKYLHERRQALGGYLPARRPKSSEQFKVPELSTFQAVLDPTAEGREISTTQAFVRILTALTRDKELGPRIVPIVPDEARTFGMEGMFRQLGIYAPEGQKYEPVDKDQVMYYREDKAGQILEEGINEAGAMSDWIAAATSYATNDRVMLPFYIYYSMFGFQRIGDLAWAAGDMQARGFLLGGTSGRTTLNGEGLQHEDGHSHLMSATIPNCMSYDPTFAHELAVIIQHGLKRIVEKQDNVFYYLSVMNENYAQPGLKPGTEDGIIKGMYKLKEGEAKLKTRVQLLGSGTILRESLAAQELLAKDWGIAADVWSVTSYTELARDGYDAERWNMLHPTEKAKVPYVTAQLESSVGPIISSTDYMRLFSDQVRPYMPKGRTFKVLGTDGFGRSDFRYKLRNHFEVDRHFIVVAALKSLADEKQIEAAKVAEAIKKYGLNPDKQNPITA